VTSPDGYHHPVRARLRGLSLNPALSGAVAVRLVPFWSELHYTMMYRPAWPDDVFDALAAHPEVKVRAVLAESAGLTPSQRARLLGDANRTVRELAAEVPVFEAAGKPSQRWKLQKAPGPLDLSLVADGNEYVRADVAAHPSLPDSLIPVLAVDPSPRVRLALSMRPGLSEEQRAAIDYELGPDDRLEPLVWVCTTTDPEVLRGCALSAHPGLRRSSTYHPELPADLVEMLGTDEDPVVRLLLCENQPGAPAETVLRAYLETRIVTRGRLLRHPNFTPAGLARLADSADEQARAVVPMDPATSPELIERLSHDESALVRRAAAADGRLPAGRLRELFDDPATAGPAASNPGLPDDLIERILADAAGYASH
jgi:hypothetical protein